METAERNRPSAQVALPPPYPQAADGWPPGASSPGPQRPTIQEPSPSLALGSEPQEKHGGIEDLPPAAKDTPILLNPGTAGSPRPLEKAKPPLLETRISEESGKDPVGCRASVPRLEPRLSDAPRLRAEQVAGVSGLSLCA